MNLTFEIVEVHAVDQCAIIVLNMRGRDFSHLYHSHSPWRNKVCKSNDKTQRNDSAISWILEALTRTNDARKSGCPWDVFKRSAATPKANETEVRAVTVCKKKIVQFSFDWSQPLPEKPKPRVCRGVCINLKILFFSLWRDTTMLSSRGKLKGKKNPCKFYFNQSADSTSLCSNLSYIFLHQPVISYISQTDLWYPVENRHKVRETLWNCGC